jgi:hypothetical protein
MRRRDEGELKGMVVLFVFCILTEDFVYTGEVSGRKGDR